VGNTSAGPYELPALRPVPFSSKITILFSTDAGSSTTPGQFAETFGEPPRIDMVFGEPADVVARREYASGGDDPRLTHRLTHLLLEAPGLRDELTETRLFFGGQALSSGLVCFSVSSPDAFAQTLKQVMKFDLPGPGGKRFDYLTIDEDDHCLLSAHLAAGQTYVVDLDANKVIATITDTPGAEGVEYVPELKMFYTSNAHDNTIGVVDLKQMKVVKKLKTEAKPVGSTYAAPFHTVSDERGKAEAVVDVQKDEIIRTLHFDSETGMPQYDPVARKVHVNQQDQNILAVINPATDEVAGR
jgi:DNA-binding beta-propeller fold protein YncE